jgi:hypothetical protein
VRNFNNHHAIIRDGSMQVVQHRGDIRRGMVFKGMTKDGDLGLLPT